jgi:hypothetical protein
MLKVFDRTQPRMPVRCRQFGWVSGSIICNAAVSSPSSFSASRHTVFTFFECGGDEPAEAGTQGGVVRVSTGTRNSCRLMVGSVDHFLVVAALCAYQKPQSVGWDVM